MQHLIRFDDYTKDDVYEIFQIADEIKDGKYQKFLEGKTVILFFPNSSIRTRVAFEKGIHLLGGQTILFPPEALDKREKLEDVIRYLNNWADAAVIRHKNIAIMDEIAQYASFPVINALTDENHPCEILSDLYALSKLRNNFCTDKFLFVGAKGNIGGAWQEAAQVMGFVSTDNVGSEGLEAYYDSYLQGTAGKVVTTKGNYGSEMLYTYEKYYDASDGDSLVTTIDQTVQHYLEKNLETAIEKYDIINGAFGIVMDVNSGQILAMANLGSYDPNNYQEIYDQALAGQLEAQYQDALLLDKDSDAYQEAMSAYNQAVAAERLRQWRNRCVSDGYEPGSTFKLVTLAAALDCGAVTENSTFYCGGHETFNDREQEVSCWKAAGHGMQTTMEALGHSCNIAFGHIGVNMTRKTFVEYFKAFGFLEKTGVDLPGEASGLFWAEDKFSVANLISASFGQTFRVTPMEQVRAVAAIVNGGYLLKPYVVSQVLDSDGNIVKSNERTVLRQVISEETSATMCKMMEYVVTDGTAGSAKTPGYRVGGKTGTSEKIDTYDENGKPVEDKIVSFIGVAPIDDPKYVVLVALDTPNYVAGTSYTPHNQYISGGLMAAPTVRDVFLDILPYLGVEPDYSSDDIRGVNITLPDVIGMTEDEAAALLSGKSITYRTVGQGSTVSDQLPNPGAEVPGNSEIILYFGNAVKTTEQVEVPDFVGYGIADVDYLATNAGLYIQAKGTDHRDEYVTVAYQDIEPGTMVDRGTTITVEFTTGGASD